MLLLEQFLTLCVALFAAWTLAVHACMAFGWPVWASLPVFATAMALLHRAIRPNWGKAWRASRAERSWLAVLLGMALAFAALALVLDVPTADDFNFFHRALAQLASLREPFLLRDTAFNAPGLAAISPLHALTTWEPGVALAAYAIGIEPLSAYHNGTVVLLHLVLVATVAVWLRTLGFGLTASCLGVAAVLLFLLVDDPSLRSFGHAYRTLWVGKAAQWAVLFPLLLWFAWREWRDPSLGHWLLVVCGCSAAVGLSGTGVFLAPALVGCAAVAGLVSEPGAARSRALQARALRLVAASFHPVAIGLLLLVGVLERPADMNAWIEGFPDAWSENLMISLGNGAGVLRNAALVLLVPAVALEGVARRFLIGLSAALLLLFVNPWAGELWLTLVQPGSYWRFLFLFPVPLGAGIAVASLVAPLRAERTRLARSACAVAIALVAAAALWPAPDARRMPLPFRTKAPLEWRLPAAEASFAREAAPLLEGRSLLAGPPLSWVAPLVVQGLRVEAARQKDTLHVFANSGQRLEGRRRVAAWEWARSCEAFPAGARAAAESLARSVDALAFPACPEGSPGDRERRAVLDSAPGRWVEVHHGHGYRLWLRAAPVP